MDEIRMTNAIAALLRVFLEDVEAQRYGYELMAMTGFASGKMYPLLARLQAVGWLIKEVERIDPSEEGRPARRLYRLDPDGVAAARLAVAEYSGRRKPRGARGVLPQPSGGKA